MCKYTQKDIELECKNFTSCKNKTASSDGVNYTVDGTYLDPSGCMKSYGHDKNGNSRESFILETQYIT